MPNTNAPNGLAVTVRTLEGGFYEVSGLLQKDAAEAGAIFINDIVTIEADGNLDANGWTPGTTRVVGVSLNHGAASTLTTHQVVVSPSAVYVVQADTDATGLTRADVGGSSNLEYAAGSAATRLISQSVLDRSAGAPDATATRDLKIVKWYERDDNETGQFARVMVVINKHLFTRETAGVA